MSNGGINRLKDMEAYRCQCWAPLQHTSSCSLWDGPDHRRPWEAKGAEGTCCPASAGGLPPPPLEELFVTKGALNLGSAL